MKQCAKTVLDSYQLTNSQKQAWRVFLFTLIGAVPSVATAQYFSAPEITDLNGVIWSPTVSSDGLAIFYTDWSGGVFDLYTARRGSTEEEWGLAEPAYDLNSSLDEDSVALSTDGLTILFGSQGWGGKGNWDLWQSTREDRGADWSIPVNLDAINTSGGESTPSLSADGLTLYFSSGCCFETRAGSISNSSDIWMSTRDDTDSGWSTPTNLASVNSSSHDAYPSISQDGLQLYFMSTRSGGFGREDVYIATRETVEDDFSTPMNLGPTINSDRVEFSPSIATDGTLYYTYAATYSQEPWKIWTARPTDPVVGDLNGDEQFDILDLELLNESIRHRRHNILGFDLNADDRIDAADLQFWVTEIKQSWIGDVNLDGEFNSTDLVLVFEAGEYEDGKRLNSTYREGDWNVDREFDSADYNLGATTGDREPT